MRRGHVASHAAGPALLAFAALAAAQQAPPDVFVDEGACPFECCTYGAWKAKADILVYASPDKDAAPIATLGEETDVEAINGHVRTRGAPFLVTRAQHDVKPGERFLVYTYLGEGIFRVWRNGQWEEWELGFSPAGGTAGSRCEVVGEGCFGHLERELVSEWWAQVRLPDGRLAWVEGHAGFDGQDACGVDAPPEPPPAQRQP